MRTRFLVLGGLGGRPWRNDCWALNVPTRAGAFDLDFAAPKLFCLGLTRTDCHSLGRRGLGGLAGVARLGLSQLLLHLHQVQHAVLDRRAQVIERGKCRRSPPCTGECRLVGQGDLPTATAWRHFPSAGAVARHLSCPLAVCDVQKGFINHCGVGYGLGRSRAVLSLVVRLVGGAVITLADGAHVCACALHGGGHTS